MRIITEAQESCLLVVVVVVVVVLVVVVLVVVVLVVEVLVVVLLLVLVVLLLVLVVLPLLLQDSCLCPVPSLVCLVSMLDATSRLRWCAAGPFLQWQLLPVHIAHLRLLIGPVEPRDGR